MHYTHNTPASWKALTQQVNCLTGDGHPLTESDWDFVKSEGYTGPTEHSHQVVPQLGLWSHFYGQSQQRWEQQLETQREFLREMPARVRASNKVIRLPKRYTKVWRAHQDWTVVLVGHAMLEVNPGKELQPTWCRVHFMGWDLPALKMRRHDVGRLTTGKTAGGFVLALTPVYPIEGYSLNEDANTNGGAK